MVDKKNIKGRVFNITLNDKTIQKGWYLIVTDTGQEYLVQRNCSLSIKRSFNIYQTKYQFIRHTMEPRQNRVKNYSTVGIVVLLSAVTRMIIPIEFWFGPTNTGMNLYQGSLNLLILILTVFISFLYVFVYRKLKLKFYLEKRKSFLKRIGRVRALTPLKTTKEGNSFW